MRMAAVALVVGVAACGAAREAPAPAPPRALPGPPAAPPAARAAPSPPEAVAVARDLDLYEAAHGSPFVGHVDEGVVLDWRDDGFVRVRVSGKELAGYPAPLPRKKGSGIGLYASRDVALRTTDGATVATALRGAFLVARRVDGAKVEVEFDGKRDGLSVERAALTTTRIAPEPRHPRGRIVTNVHAAIVVGRFRAVAACTDAVEVREDGRVAIVHDDVEVVGAVADVSGCRPRTVRRDHGGTAPEVPAGYVRAGAMRVTAFAKKRTFWFEHEGACRSEVFTPNARGGTLEHTEPLGALFGDADPARGWTATYKDDLQGAKPLLTKPTALESVALATVYRDPRGKVGQPPGHGEGIALCGNPEWLVVGEDEAGVKLLASTGEEAVAYRPEDVSVWYTSEAACTRAAAMRAELAKRDPLAAARPSVGCGD